MRCIEQLSQTISCGMVFLVLQIKEFLFSYLNITDCMIGSIFYFTTGLHGAHVFFGLLYFYLIFLLMLGSLLRICPFFLFIFFSNLKYIFLKDGRVSYLSLSLAPFFSHRSSIYYAEFSFSLLFSSYYWHFVDVV